MSKRRSNDPKHRASVMLVDKKTLRVNATRLVFNDQEDCTSIIQEAMKGLCRKNGTSSSYLIAVSPPSLDPRSLGRGRTTPSLLSSIRDANTGHLRPQEPRTAGSKVA